MVERQKYIKITKHFGSRKETHCICFRKWLPKCTVQFFRCNFVLVDEYSTVLCNVLLRVDIKGYLNLMTGHAAIFEIHTHNILRFSSSSSCLTIRVNWINI